MTDNAYVVFDALRLEVVPSEVRAFVNGVDLADAAAGMGMNPFEVLVPVNRLARPGTVPSRGAARAACTTASAPTSPCGARARWSRGPGPDVLTGAPPLPDGVAGASWRCFVIG